MVPLRYRLVVPPPSYPRTLAATLQDDSIVPEYQQDLLEAIIKNVSKIKDSEELDRFLELMNTNLSSDEDSESSETEHSEVKSESQISEPIAKRLRNNANEPMQVKTDAAPTCEAPYFKLKIQLAWFLSSKNKKADFEYLKKCVFT